MRRSKRMENYAKESSSYKRPHISKGLHGEFFCFWGRHKRNLGLLAEDFCETMNKKNLKNSHKLYESDEEFKLLFSSCVTRDFGENRFVCIDGEQYIACVQPLNSDPEYMGLKAIGYCL